MFSVSRPTAQVVSNRCVTETNLTLAAAGIFELLARSILTVTGMLRAVRPQVAADGVRRNVHTIDLAFTRGLGLDCARMPLRHVHRALSQRIRSNRRFDL